jgi:glutamyl-tRNA synthetase
MWAASGPEELICEDLRWLGLHWDEGPRWGPHGPYRRATDAAAAGPLADGGTAAGAGGQLRQPGTVKGRCPLLGRAVGPEEQRARNLAEGRPIRRFSGPEGGDSVDVEDQIGALSPLQRDVKPTLRHPAPRMAPLPNCWWWMTAHGHHPRPSTMSAISNTPRQRSCADALGRPRPFSHIPTVPAPEGGKLSKRTGRRARTNFGRGV